MPTLNDIKKRIQTTKNIQQITKAMEAVSASKMRKSQLTALNSRAYALSCLEILANLKEAKKDHWLFNENDIDKIGILVVTSDKGLCGGYNASVLKKLDEFKKDKNVELITVGKKAGNYCKRRNYNINGEFVDFGDYVAPIETSSVSRLLSDRFKDKKYKEIWAIYTNFKSTLSQEVILRKIMPIDMKFIKDIIPEEKDFSYEYKLEPTPEHIFENLVPFLFEISIHHIVIESNASEHSARMMAMKNASENASDIMDELSLSYNKARQAKITKELLEVVGGKEALEVS